MPAQTPCRFGGVSPLAQRISYRPASKIRWKKPFGGAIPSIKDIAYLQDTFGIQDQELADYGYTKSGYTFLEYETDSDLRDSEKIPVKEDIHEYFLREVRPYVADAWISLPATKIGCEISFNKYFYKPAPLRTLEENEADIRALDEQSQGFIKSLFEIL